METDLIIIIGILLNILWFYLLMKTNSREERMKREIERNINIAYEHLKNTIIMRAEQHGEMIYLYNQHTNEFVCQGKTLEDLHKSFGARFPGQKALVDQGHEIIFKEK